MVGMERHCLFLRVNYMHAWQWRSQAKPEAWAPPVREEGQQPEAKDGTPLTVALPPPLTVGSGTVAFAPTSERCLGLAGSSSPRGSPRRRRRCHRAGARR